METRIPEARLKGIMEMLSATDLDHGDTLIIEEGTMTLVDAKNKPVISSTQLLNPPYERWFINK